MNENEKEKAQKKTTQKQNKQTLFFELFRKGLVGKDFYAFILFLFFKGRYLQIHCVNVNNKKKKTKQNKPDEKNLNNS